MFLLRIVMQRKILILLLLAVSALAAAFEGFSMALVFPFLQGFSGGSSIKLPFPFNNISGLFSGMPLQERVRLITVMLFLSTIIKGSLVYLAIVLTNRLRIFAIRRLRMECARQIMKVDIGYFNKQRISDFYVIFESYTESSAGAIVNLIGGALPQVFTIILLLAFLFILSVKLTLLAICLVIIAYFLMSSLTKQVSRMGRVVIDKRYTFNKILFDMFNGMKLIRLFNREPFIIDKFRVSLDEYNASTSVVAKLAGLIGPLFETVGIGILAAIFIAGSFIIRNDVASWIGILGTFVIILTRIINPAKGLVQARTAIAEKSPAIRELDNFLKTQNKSYIRNGNKIFRVLERGISFNNVSFGYNPTEKIVLEDVSFFVPKGATLGIVGRSGSGKSTIIELLLRFYDPQKGQIRIDGADLKDYDLNSWRRHVGVVSQDVFLFNDTIRANIAFGRQNATQQEIAAAAKKAHIHEFILSLPHGYDSCIGERGVLLSGGQRQRISIARAIISDPEVLIFDEATSSLDTESEKIVQQALNEISAGKTLITIAHRLSTITNSDIIIVLDAGRLVAMDKHEDLYQRCSVYKKLVELQRLQEA